MGITQANRLAEGTKYKILRYNRDNCKVKSKCYAITWKDELNQTRVTYPMTAVRITEWLRNKIHEEEYKYV